MKYPEDFLKKIMQCGTLHYPLSKILNIIDVENETEFKNDWKDKNSEVSKAYQKGVDRADFILDSKLFEMAKEGDMKAMEEYERRKKIQIRKKEDDDFESQLE